VGRGVVLDTSFFISLADSKRANHLAARKYWKYFLENEIPIYLSTIVVSEFYLKQELPPEILRSCVILPFNWNDAIKASGLDFRSHAGDRESRQASKDDVKIIAQAEMIGAEYLVTDDESTLFKFAKRCKGSGQIACGCIRLSEGFDRAHFASGQKDFHDQLGEDESA
jgi:predicted nucleic acid-binding protein